jgi:hypothetical protein
MHTYELSGYQIDQRRGWLLRAIPYSDPELLHPEDLIWPPGIDNFRVQYTAGYSTIPEDVQEACAELVVGTYKLFDQNQLFSHETIPGQSHQFPAAGSWPVNIRTLLAPYRQQRVGIHQS